MGQVPISGVHKHKYSTNDVYEGNFEDSQRSGHGTLTQANGDIYSGDWLFDKRHGTGEMKYTTSSIIGQNSNHEEDELPDYIPNDERSLRFRAWQRAKHYRQQQRVLENVFFGQYDGFWLTDKRNGFGHFSYSNRDEFYGEWSNDMRQGKGLLLYGGSLDEYQGQFQTNHIQGWGTMKMGLFPEVQTKYQQMTQITIAVVKYWVMKNLFAQLKQPLPFVYQLSDEVIEKFYAQSLNLNASNNTNGANFIQSAQSFQQTAQNLHNSPNIVPRNEYDTDMHMSSTLPHINLDYHDDVPASSSLVQINLDSVDSAAVNDQYADGYVSSYEKEAGYVSSYADPKTPSQSHPHSQTAPNKANRSIPMPPPSATKKKAPKKVKKYDCEKFSIDLKQILAFSMPAMSVQQQQLIAPLMEYAIEHEEKKQRSATLHPCLQFITHSIEIEGFWLSNQLSGPNPRYFAPNSQNTQNTQNTQNASKSMNLTPNLHGFCIIRKYTPITSENMNQRFADQEMIQNAYNDAESNESTSDRTKYALITSADSIQYFCEIRIVPVSVGRKCVETYGKIDIDILELEANQEIQLEDGNFDELEQFDENGASGQINGKSTNEPELGKLDDFLASPQLSPHQSQSQSQAQKPHPTEQALPVHTTSAVAVVAPANEGYIVKSPQKQKEEQQSRLKRASASNDDEKRGNDHDTSHLETQLKALELAQQGSIYTEGNDSISSIPANTSVQAISFGTLDSSDDEDIGITFSQNQPEQTQNELLSSQAAQKAILRAESLVDDDADFAIGDDDDQ